MSLSAQGIPVEYAALIERLAADRFFAYYVCAEGHVHQTAFGNENYPCYTPGCGRSVRLATRYLAESLRAAERGRTWIGDPLGTSESDAAGRPDCVSRDGGQ